MRKVSKIVHEWNGHLEIYSRLQAIQNYRQYLFLRTDLSVSQIMRLTARCPTKTELEFTFLEQGIGCLRQNTKLPRSVFMHVHNILILTRAARHTCKFCPSTTSGNHTINHVRGTDKAIHNQPGTLFPHLIRAKYHQITLTHSITLAFSTSIIRCIKRS